MEKTILNQAVCKSCKFCMKFCPKGAISLSGKYNKLGYEAVCLDESKCIHCGICYTVCPEIAFTIVKVEEDSK